MKFFATTLLVAAVEAWKAPVAHQVEVAYTGHHGHYGHYGHGLHSHTTHVTKLVPKTTYETVEKTHYVDVEVPTTEEVEVTKEVVEI